MTTEELETLACIRASVGFLGEKDQHAWWASSFFSKSSATFLAPLFPRTQVLSQATGVTAAATLLHDERIGVGQVFHLFRLPEDLEQSLHRVLSDPGTVSKIGQLVSTVESAMTGLRELGATKTKTSAGPVHVGDLHALRDSAIWKNVAAIYADAFDTKRQSFPYFADQN